MDSANTFGLLLVGLSAFLLAAHWQQWRFFDGSDQRSDPRQSDYTVRSLRRRCVASSLIGLIGVMLILFETVPHEPLPITAYLLSLVLMTSWIVWLAFLDLRAGRRFQQQQQLDEIATEIRQTQGNTAELPSHKK